MAIGIVQLLLTVLAPVWGIGLFIVPIGVIVSAVMRKDRTIVWKTGWILVTFLYLPAFVYGLLHFKNLISRIFTGFVLVCLLLTAGGTIYYNYDRANGDVVKALMFFFEKEKPKAPNDPFKYGNYMPNYDPEKHNYDPERDRPVMPSKTPESEAPVTETIE